MGLLESVPFPPPNLSAVVFESFEKQRESLVFSLRHCVLFMTLVLNGHLQKSYPHKQHLEWLRAAPDGLPETDSIVLQMILKMCWVSDCAMLINVDRNTISWQFITILHFGKVVAIYEFVQSHSYIFV